MNISYKFTYIIFNQKCKLKNIRIYIRKRLIKEKTFLDAGLKTVLRRFFMRFVADSNRR